MNLSILRSLLLLSVILLFTACTSSGNPAASVPAPPVWPEVGSESKVWTRWWWHGNAVTAAGITTELEGLQRAGFGGLELTPIFGVIGEEDEFVDYLSPAWMDLFEHTLREATRLGMQIDLATGTGWPFGGPWVGREDACKYLAHTSYELGGGERLTEPVSFTQKPIFRRINNRALLAYRAAQNPTVVVPEIKLEDLDPDIGGNDNLQALALDQVRFAEPLPLLALMAYEAGGQVLDLTDQVDENGWLDWTAPAGSWTLYALFQGLHGKMVERAAPGGEGNVIDHFSRPAITNYLKRFDTAFAGRETGTIRAFFNDSYEVDDASGQANWTPAFLDAFAAKRGYDLRNHLPAAFGNTADANENVRVLSDVRETFSDLLLETFTAEWSAWAKARGAVVRNQSHGSPANILDLYAASDIPETEGTQPLRIKFATSAAHVTGKRLVSAEAGTWLREHFLANWTDLKQNLDRYLVHGVNHLVYHGNAYSPPGDAFPGRLFYAAFHANHRNPLWEDLATINAYVGRTQAFLQRGSPDNDILLYFPAYDRFATPRPELLEHFDGHGPELDETAVAKIGEELLAAGYAFDFVSDKQLQAAGLRHRLVPGTSSYTTVIVPRTDYMPVATFSALRELAAAGTMILFQDRLPGSVPGLAEVEVRTRELARQKAALDFKLIDGVMRAETAGGSLIVTERWREALPRLPLRREGMAGLGLTFSRRRYQGGHLYFVANWTKKAIDDYVPLASPGKVAVIYQPTTGASGLARTKAQDEQLDVFLQLAPGESTLVWVSPEATAGEPWPYFFPGDNVQTLVGPWQLDFFEGGPELPPALTLTGPETWDAREDPAYRFFSGKGRYRTTFARPAAAEAYLLDLGKVFETARVSLNGRELGTLTGPTYRVRVSPILLRDRNELTVEVSSRMVNRIIKMDRDGVFWKKFYNVNFPAHLRENVGPLGIFDAAGWSPVHSGLAGPVTLTAGSTTKSR